MDDIAHILVTTDFSKPSERALKAAQTMAERFDAEVTLLHVYDPGDQLPPETVPLTAQQRRTVDKERRHELQARLDKLRSSKLRRVAEVNTVIVKGRNPAEAICDYAAAHEVGAIVIATHGRTGVSRWLIGSVAERVVRHASCPVLVVRGHGTEA